MTTTKTRSLYEVKTIWRYKPEGRRPYYATKTEGILAWDASDACRLAEEGFDPAYGDVDRMRHKVRTPGLRVTGEVTRRCRHDRWDGHSPGDFLPAYYEELS